MVVRNFVFSLKSHSMKKTVFALAVILYTQLLFSQTKAGLKVGVNYSGTAIELSDLSRSFGAKKEDYGVTSAKPGLQAGFLVNMLTEMNFGIRFELLLNMRNWETNYYRKEMLDPTVLSEYGSIEKVNTAYLDLPIDFVYSLPLGENRVEILFGLNTAFGLWGSSSRSYWDKITYLSTGNSTGDAGLEDNTIHFGTQPKQIQDNEIYFNSLDLGINIGTSFLLRQSLLVSLV